MTAKTGEKCPVSGVWKVDGFPTTTAPIAKGNTMPPYCGIQYATHFSCAFFIFSLLN